MEDKSAENYPRKLNTMTYLEKFAIMKEMEDGKSLANVRVFFLTKLKQLIDLIVGI